MLVAIKLVGYSNVEYVVEIDFVLYRESLRLVINETTRL